jgi:dipeptide/tripeptide permease
VVEQAESTLIAIAAITETRDTSTGTSSRTCASVLISLVFSAVGFWETYQQAGQHLDLTRQIYSRVEAAIAGHQ